MKLLIICQYYDPEPFRVHDLCSALAGMGHEVQVVTGMPNYPSGELYPGFEDNRPRDERMDGVRIHRCPIHPRKTGALHRFRNYSSFASQASRYVRSAACASEDGTAFDLVLVYQLSPVMMAKPALAYRKKHPVPILMYCLDLWPESLLAGSISKKSPIYRHYHSLSGKLYSAMDRILVTSEQFRPYLTREFGIPEKRIDYLPQYAETLFAPQPPRVPDGEIRLTFAGNVGKLQNVGVLLEAAKLLRDKPVVFHIAGDGSELEHLKTQAEAEKLSNVRFLGRRPVEEMPALYAQADAMLVTMKNDPVLSLTLPGKVQSYLASGKPILGSIGGEAARVIEEAGCGFCAPPEDPAALADVILRFLGTPDREALGARAREYYTAHFERDRFLDRMVRELQTLMRS